MQLYNMTKRGILALIIILSMSVSGCIVRGHVDGPVVYPPHYYNYYYYPGVQVYFHIATGSYFYFDNGIWIKARILPSHIHLHSHNRVNVNVRDSKPYIRQPEHIKKYKPDTRYKPTKKYDQKERKSNIKYHKDYKDKNRSKRK